MQASWHYRDRNMEAIEPQEDEGILEFIRRASREKPVQDIKLPGEPEPVLALADSTIEELLRHFNGVLGEAYEFLCSIANERNRPILVSTHKGDHGGGVLKPEGWTDQQTIDWMTDLANDLQAHQPHEVNVYHHGDVLPSAFLREMVETTPRFGADLADDKGKSAFILSIEPEFKDDLLAEFAGDIQAMTDFVQEMTNLRGEPILIFLQPNGVKLYACMLPEGMSDEDQAMWSKRVELATGGTQHAEAEVDAEIQRRGAAQGAVRTLMVGDRIDDFMRSGRPVPEHTAYCFRCGEPVGYAPASMRVIQSAKLNKADVDPCCSVCALALAKEMQDNNERRN